MPTTSPLPSLKIGLRRADVGAFWVLLTSVVSLALVVVASALGAHTPWAWGLAGLCLALPRLVWSPWFEMGVRAWNKGVSLSLPVLRAYVLRVCYYLLFGPLSRGGAGLGLALATSEASRWIPRERHDASFGDRDRVSSAGGWWGRELLNGAKNPGKAWTVCLLPVVMLLLVLRDEAQESAVPSNTYTLY
jgi:hypothetical protein